MERTELINQIITSPEAERILDFVSPIYGKSYVGLWLFEVIGRELDDMYHWAVEFGDQTVPNRATWSLPYWEEEYGIIPDPDATIEERRAAILQKVIYRAPMNPKKLASIVSVSAGVPTDIEENTGKNRFTVILRDLPINRLSGATKSVAAARRTVDEAKPAHLIYNLRVEKQVEVARPIKIAVAMTQYKSYHVDVLSGHSRIELDSKPIRIATATSQHKKNFITVS